MKINIFTNAKTLLSKWRQILIFRKLLIRCRPLNIGENNLSPKCNNLSSLSNIQGKKKRRPFPKDESLPVIVGFGSKDSWQMNGLWPGFRSVSDFYLCEIPNDRLPGVRSEIHDREKKMNFFLNFVDDLDKKKTIHMAFFYHSGHHIADELIAGLHLRGIRTVIMSLDDKHQFSYPKDPISKEPHQIRVARQVDLYWTTWKAGAYLISNIGGNPWYNGEAANPEYHRPLNIKHDLDVVFIGKNYGYRNRIINYLRKRGISIHCFGAGWPNGQVSSQDMIQLFNRAKIVLGIGGVGHMSGVQHLKGRDFEVPMCGALYLTSYNPDLCDFFNIGYEILCYSSLEECEELIIRYLDDPDTCESIRSAARDRSLKDHTWEKRLNSVLNLFRHN